jgi:DNA-directed RNA polymerase subunit beta
MNDLLTCRWRVRKDFSKIKTVIGVPHLLGVQRRSYDHFLQRGIPPQDRENHGLQGVFTSVFPIHDFKDLVTLEFVSYDIGDAKYSEDECRERGMTFAAPLKVTVKLNYWEGEGGKSERRVKKILENEIYFCDLPMMTETGTFIINGTERVIVSQMHKSPGLFIESQKNKSSSGVKLYSARIIPYNGSWLDLEYDSKELIHARIDRKRKFLVTTLLQALGLSRQEILATYLRGERVLLPPGGAPELDLGLDELKKELDADRNLTGLRLGWPMILDAVKGGTLYRQGNWITKDVIQRIREKGISKIALDQKDLEGKYLARDVIDGNTGEILGEANTEVTAELLEDLAQAGIGEIQIQVPEWWVKRRDREDRQIHFNFESLRDTLAHDIIRTQEEAKIEIYRRLRPGEPPTLETSGIFFENLFFNPKRYDLSSVGRMKMNQRLGLSVPMDERTLNRRDILEALRFLIKSQVDQVPQDDVDHLGNRRVKAVSELLENQLRIGLIRMERSIKERMGVQETDDLVLPDLVNAKPVDAAIKEFFGSSQLSQFMDQTNPLSEITHKRRLSALGPGGLTRERAGFEVRDVHPTHYGRICPIETPEGPNIGLITSLSTFAQVNKFGFVETPLRKVKEGVVSNDIDYLTADEGERYVVAQANTPLAPDGTIMADKVSARKSGDFIEAPPGDVQYMDVSPKQIVSVSTAMIPFLEHDDANRALMGSNMQRQAVPLLKTESPLVGTGMEGIVARDSGVVVLSRVDGVVEKVDAQRIIVRVEEEEGLSGRVQNYNLKKFKRSNQNTCLNQKPVVKEGDRVVKGQVLADGAAVEKGELALGKNVLVAFMPWGGYNFEDAILLSERLVREDVFTSIHIEEFEVEARDTKLGKEEITRDIPGVGEESLKNLDDSGIIRIAAEVTAGDILVGKITPKGETQLTPEEKLLRAIFGEKAGDVKDSSLTVPPGIEGTVVDVKVFSRRGAEKDERAKMIEDEEIGKYQRDLDDNIRITREEERKRIARLLVGLKAPLSIRDRTTGKVAVKKGSVVEAGAAGNLEITDDLIRALSDEGVRNAVSAVKEQTAAAEDWLRKRFDEKINRLRKGDELPPGVIKMVKVYIAIKRKISVGDKMAGRHGNKGVVSMILPIEDMPYLPDGTPVDVILNPLGVPSRMNVGQILETHLGWAAKGLGMAIGAMVDRGDAASLREKLDQIYAAGELGGFTREADDPTILDYGEVLRGGVPMATPVFEGTREQEVKQTLALSGMPESGKTVLFDGRTGKRFDQEVTVGYIYLLKLHHLVDDKIHARSIGPYSLVTQQPLGGKAQFGGQRFGEMEVWALEAYGAGYILQEMLTVKSDDVIGRTKVFESIVKGKENHQAGIPESFNVMIKELQGLGLDVELLEKRPQDAE